MKGKKIIFALFLQIWLSLVVAESLDWTEILLDGSQTIDDLKCDVGSVREANSRQLHSILNELLNTTYFRLFKVPADGECPLNAVKEVKHQLEDDGLCEGGNFEQNLGPLLQGGLFGSMDFSSTESQSKCEVESENLDHTITKSENIALDVAEDSLDCNDETKPSFWLNMCLKLEEENDEKEEFVNLQKNIEHFTGYNGTKIWNTIYSQNCFQGEMCLEERVLFRLTSGLHASINTHIALNFFEDYASGERKFKPNPERFVRAVGSYPERVENLYFSFVFLLRAVKKADDLLKKNDYSVGNVAEEQRVEDLLRHLLNSDVIQSCRSVFEAFDERLLFQETDLSLKQLKREFKEVFFNISSYFNCIKCQRCKLHGKMQLLGIGTALKILLVPKENFDLVTLSREEIVALINTLGKFSEAVESIPRLVSMYWEQQNAGSAQIADAKQEEKLDFNVKAEGLRGIALGLKNAPHLQRFEEKLVDALLDEDPEMIALAEFFKISGDPDRFVKHAIRRVIKEESVEEESDAIVIGSGLAGLSAALTILDNGGSVIIVDKEKMIGGNSVKASSGINAVSEGDSMDLFFDDVIRSGRNEEGGEEWERKVRKLVSESAAALNFIEDRVGLKLENRGQLGGHSVARTFRPNKGLAGSEMVAKLWGEVKKFESTGRLKVLLDTKVVDLERKGDEIVAVKAEKGSEKLRLEARNIIIATGGYAFTSEDNRPLKEFRPDLLKLRTTNGAHAIGDGVVLVEKLEKKDLTNMDQVQVHPTGFLELEEVLGGKRSGGTVKLCAEILRGVGALLVDQDGKRFVNELATRDFISDTMLRHYKDGREPVFYILMNAAMAKETESHVSMYTRSGLLEQFSSLEEVSKRLNLDVEVLRQSLSEYNAAESGGDAFGKTVFNNLPVDESSAPFFVGAVTPVVHYTMGGVATDVEGRVPGFRNLFAIGEVVGGLHGKNRLGGNALTECVVSGRSVGSLISGKKSEDVKEETKEKVIEEVIEVEKPKPVKAPARMDEITMEQVKKRNRKEDCWVALGGKVYDLSSFIYQHPAGPKPIIQLCGTDGSDTFLEVHSYDLLWSYSLNPIGTLKA